MSAWQYIKNILIGIDQLVNAALFGDPDETLSSRAGKGRLLGDPIWGPMADLIDLLFYVFEKDHCNKSIERDEGKRLH